MSEEDCEVDYSHSGFLPSEAGINQGRQPDRDSTEKLSMPRTAFII